MHRAFYVTRQEAGAVVHLHSTMATAVACLPDVDAANPIPPLTPYFVMRVGRRMPIVPYYRPGDPAMEPAINAAAKDARAVLLANHGPVVSGKTLDDAVYAAEELEEAAKLALLLRAKYLVDVVSYTKVRGLPFPADELAGAIRDVLLDLEPADVDEQAVEVGA